VAEAFHKAARLKVGTFGEDTRVTKDHHISAIKNRPTRQGVGGTASLSGL